MRNRFVGLILGIAGVISFSPAAFAQSQATGVKPAAGKAAAAKPDFSGVWKARNTPQDFSHPEGPGVGNGGGWNGKYTGSGFGFLDSKWEQPVMLPWAQAKYNAIREGSSEAMQPRKNVEPNLNCVPGGFPWVYDRAMLDPFELIQTPKKIVMMFTTDGAWRQIYLDGRKNPEGAPDTFMGYSTGKWEGDALVVETSGISDLTWIDRLGHPHSDALRVEERIRLVGTNRLDVDLLFDDSKTYAKPWKGKKIYFRQKPDVEVTENYACEDVWMKEYPEKLRKEIGEFKRP